MTVHYVDIYHCQKCGRVTSCEHEDQVPKCCGEPMAQAVANITYDKDQSEASSTEKPRKGPHRLNPSKRK